MLEARVDAKRLASGERLLHDVRLTASPGEIVALLGASGTGKTTTLRILLGLDRDFEGAVRRDAVRVGAVFQEPRLLPWRTVGENIALAVPRGHPGPGIAALLGDVGLAGIETLYPRQISLGMARRVALARAFAVEPDLLVLDEPFASLDQSAAGMVAAALTRRARNAGAAVVIAMHDLDRAFALATQIVVLAGRPATVAERVELAAGTTGTERARLRTALTRKHHFLDAPPPEPCDRNPSGWAVPA